MAEVIRDAGTASTESPTFWLSDARFKERIYTDLWFEARRAGAEKLVALLAAD